MIVINFVVILMFGFVFLFGFMVGRAFGRTEQSVKSIIVNFFDRD